MNDKIPNMDYDADEVIDSFKSKFKWPDKDDVEVVVKPKNLPKKILLSLLTTVIVGAVAYYMMIPALNFKSTDFYTFIFLLIAESSGLAESAISLSDIIERSSFSRSQLFGLSCEKR